MNYRFELVNDLRDVAKLQTLLEDGKWVPDKCYNNDIDFLVLLKKGEDEKTGEFDNVVDVQAVDFENVADMVQKGYVVQTIYAKNTIMILRKDASPATETHAPNTNKLAEDY